VNETEATRTRYFNFFRWRLNRAASSKSTQGLAVVCRYLGSLAEHWMATSEEPRKTAPDDRFRLFLASHGHHDAWSRVSAPLLRDRTDSARGKSVIEAKFPFERFVPDRVNPIATWKSDPSFNERDASELVSRTLLVACSYPGLVYDELVRPFMDGLGPNALTFETPWHDELGDGTPRYRYDSLTSKLRLIVPVSFVVETAERAVRSFEAEAIDRDILPFPIRA
jgi:hypothetical protein